MMGCHITDFDANELLFEDHHEDGCEIINRGEYLSLYAEDSIHIDREFAGILAGHLQRWSETGSFLEPVDNAEPAEEATAKFLNGLGDEIKALAEAHGELVEACARTDEFANKLAERVAALEQAKEPERWGLWGQGSAMKEPRWMLTCDGDRIYTEKEAKEDAESLRVNSHSKAIIEWKAYPYPADGGPPLELRTKPQPYGLWNIKGEHWHTESPFESAGDAGRYATKTLYADWRNQWRVYEYPNDGGRPMELREPETPKLPELWGVWYTKLQRWAGPPAYKGVTLFCSENEAVEFCKGTANAEPRILPIEELIRD